MSCNLNLSHEGKVQSLINQFASNGHMILPEAQLLFTFKKFGSVVNFEIASYSKKKAQVRQHMAWKIPSIDGGLSHAPPVTTLLGIENTAGKIPKS